MNSSFHARGGGENSLTSHRRYLSERGPSTPQSLRIREAFAPLRMTVHL